MVQYIAAIDTISKLREAIDRHLFVDALKQLQQRTWLLHWSLFIYWNVDDGCTQLLDLFMHDMFTVAMQVNSPHLLRCADLCSLSMIMYSVSARAVT
jgi:translation initiation factor 3 subunit E